MFSRPSFLFFAFFLLLPILFHLFLRGPLKKVPLPTTRFLPPTPPQKRRLRRVSDPIVLSLRLLAFFLLLLAVVGPLRKTSTPAIVIGLKHPHFLVDGSGSMWIPSPKKTPLERAGEILMQAFKGGEYESMEISLCRGKEPLLLYRTPQPPPEEFLTPLKEQAHLGSADLLTCASSISGKGKELVILSDLPPPPNFSWDGEWVWVGVGGGQGNENLFIGKMEIDPYGIAKGEISGEGRVTLKWISPQRPEKEMEVREKKFSFSLPQSERDGFLFLDLFPEDPALWDNQIPLYLPGDPKKHLHLLGPRKSEEERYIWELLYSFRTLTILEKPDTPPAVHDPILILFSPWELGEDLEKKLKESVEGGGVAIVFPSLRKIPPSFWVGGWLNPPVKMNKGVRPTSFFLEKNEGLSHFPWQVGRISSLFVLSDPEPSVTVLLETEDHLPVLVRFLRGKGWIYLWLLRPTWEYSNLPFTPLWVPTFATLLDLKEERELPPNPILPDLLLHLDSFEKVKTLHSLSPNAFTGWIRTEEKIVPVRADPEEGKVGTFQGVIQSSPKTKEEERWKEEIDLPFLLTFLLFWVLQGYFSRSTSRSVLIPFLLSLSLPLPFYNPLYGKEEGEIHLWIPKEGGPSTEMVQTVEQLLEEGILRTSLPLHPKPHLFSLSETIPPDPWIYWGGCKPYLPGENRSLDDHLKTFLKSGGVIVFDLCGGKEEEKKFLERLTPFLPSLGIEESPNRLNTDEILFKTFYLLNGWYDPEEPEGIYSVVLEGHHRILIVKNLLFGLMKISPQRWGEREILIRQWVNMAVYAVTLDYKSDAIHIPYILERRKRHR